MGFKVAAAVLAAAVGVHADSYCPALGGQNYQDSLGNTFIIACGTSFSGADATATVEASDLSACITALGNRDAGTTYLGAQFDTQSMSCSFYNTMDGNTTSPNSETAILISTPGTTTAPNCPVDDGKQFTTNGRTYEIRCEQQYTADTTTQAAGQDLSACLEICANSDTCNGAEYDGSGTCNLYSGTPTYTGGNSAVVAGIDITPRTGSSASSSVVPSVTYGLPPVGDASSTASDANGISLIGTPAPTGSPSSSATASVGTPLSIFGLEIDFNTPARKQKRQAVGQLYLDTDGYASTTCTEQYSISDGQLFTTGGQQYSSGEYTFAVFAASDQVDGYNTEFTGQNVGDTLRFINSNFDNGEASFCIPPLDPDYVYAVYEDTIDGCQSVTLRITDCGNGNAGVSSALPSVTPSVSISTDVPSSTLSSFDPNLTLTGLPGSGAGVATSSIGLPISASGDPAVSAASASSAAAAFSGRPSFTNDPAFGQPTTTPGAGTGAGTGAGAGVGAGAGFGGNGTTNGTVAAGPSVIVYKEVIYVIECSGYLPSSVLNAFNNGMINYYCDNAAYYYAKMCPVCPIVRAYTSNNTYAERPCPVCPAEIMQCPGVQLPNGPSGMAQYGSPQCMSCAAAGNSTMPVIGPYNATNSTTLPRLTTVQVPCNACPAPSTALVVPPAAASAIQSVAAASGVPAAQSAAQSAINSAVTITQTVSRIPQQATAAPSTIVNLPCNACPAGSALATVAQTYYVPHMTGTPRAGTSAAASVNNNVPPQPVAPAGSNTSVSPAIAAFTGTASFVQVSIVGTFVAIFGAILLL